MTDIPSLTEAYTVIILIAPGFIAFRLFTWRAKYEFVFTDLQTTLFSLISSVIIFIPFAAIWQFTSIENLESQILHAHVIATYFCLSIVLGLGGGALVGVTNRKQVEVGSTWTNFAFSNVSDWVKVYTSDGKVYKGWIKQMSSHDSHKRELEIGEPKVLKEKQWAKAGESLFFTETNILRIKLLGSQEPKKD